MKLKLERPLVFFDLETTGVNVGKDKIVEISMVKLHPDQSEETKTLQVNPGMHIPEEASAIHGIYDRDVEDKPTFAQCAGEIREFLKNCDLAGYNLLKFDVPLAFPLAVMLLPSFPFRYSPLRFRLTLGAALSYLKYFVTVFSFPALSFTYTSAVCLLPAAFVFSPNPSCTVY